MRSTGWQHMEASELATAGALKHLNPSTMVLVSRNTEVGSCQFDTIRPLLVPPGPASHPGFWVSGQPGGSNCDAGTVCNGSWTCPNCGPAVSDAVPYGKLWFNWTDNGMAAWWLASYIAPALQEESIDGVYFDCSCGSPPGLISGSEASFMAAAQAGFDRHLPVALSAGKMSISWLGERVSKATCTADMRRLLGAFTPSSIETFQLEYNNDRSSFNQTLAAFLLVRQEYATFCLPSWALTSVHPSLVVLLRVARAVTLRSLTLMWTMKSQWSKPKRVQMEFLPAAGALAPSPLIATGGWRSCGPCCLPALTVVCRSKCTSACPSSHRCYTHTYSVCLEL